MATCRSSLGSYDSFDSASYCRQRFWLFVAYVVSFASIIGAAAVLLKHMAMAGGQAPPHVKWTGWVRSACKHPGGWPPMWAPSALHCASGGLHRIVALHSPNSSLTCRCHLRSPLQQSLSTVARDPVSFRCHHAFTRACGAGRGAASHLYPGQRIDLVFVKGRRGRV